MLYELLSLRHRDGVLAALSEAEYQLLANGARALDCARGTVLARAGEPSTEVYIVLQGSLVATRIGAEGVEQVLADFAPGAVANAPELIFGGRHTTSLTASEDSRLAVLSRQSFQTLLESNPDTYRMITALVQQRLRDQQLTLILNRVFGPFEPGEVGILDDLRETTDFLTVKSGEDLFCQDDPADSVYIVMSGLLRVATRSADGGEHVINQVRSGETVGEMALLTNELRSATVYAVRDSVLARIQREDFDRLIEHYPKALKQLARIIIDRLKRRSQVEIRREHLHTSVSLIPVDPAVPMEEFAGRLVASMEVHGTVLVLSSETVDLAIGQPGVAQVSEADPAYLRLAEWLHEQEEGYRYLLYQADPVWSPWTERCARQADHIAFVGLGSGSADVGETESRLADFWRVGREPRRKLVLLHAPDVDRPRGTRRWLLRRAMDAVCHIRQDRDSDYARLGRILSGRAVGLVLGGGGARGFAHLGAIKALEELGVPIDLIAGASIGAVMAIPKAQGYDADTATRLAKERFSSLLDYTLPIAALLSGRRITRSIEAHMGSWDIEDLWIPYFCVSTNLSTAEPFVHFRGDAARAVRASVSIPGVLPPVPEGAHLLVDGGVLNNLPIDIMREQNPTGIVIAVDVAPPHGPSAKGDFGLSISGWRLAWNRLLPWRRSAPIPGIASTILTSLVVGSAQVRRTSLEDGAADYYHNIRIQGVSMLQFDKVEEVARIGYQESITALGNWLDAGDVRQNWQLQTDGAENGQGQPGAERTSGST